MSDDDKKKIADDFAKTRESSRKAAAEVKLLCAQLAETIKLRQAFERHTG